ncbi:MAG TPA: hypothetical protein VK507_16290 [Iamia sp.]|nr:hypothetical protein [Iamia sp.]
MAEETHVEIADGDVTWRFERSFLTSNWTCIWGQGCKGILDRPTPELEQGCCSVGAELDGPEEGAMVSAYAAMLDPHLFQHHEEAAADGIFADERKLSTRVVDGACIFLNHPGFAGGAGCALHIAAVEADEPPLEWKPSVCWQLPLKVDWADGAAPDTEVATVRGWTRADWNEEGDEMAWCCTEEPEPYVGDRPVVESLGEELEAMVGTTVYVELRRRLAD